MSEAAELLNLVQNLTTEQQAGCLRFVIGWMGTRPECPAMKEGVEFYIRESGLAPLKE